MKKKKKTEKLKSYKQDSLRVRLPWFYSWLCHLRCDFGQISLIHASVSLYERPYVSDDTNPTELQGWHELTHSKIS